MATKVFVGNLVFSTADKQLSDYFSPVGEVVSANIITRGRRSLGYGFIEFKQEEDAIRAVELMHKKEIDGRIINVELARPRDPLREEKTALKKAFRSSTERRLRSLGKNNTENGGSNVPASSNGSALEGDAESANSRPPRTSRNANRSRRLTQPNRRSSDSTLFVANLPYSVDREQLLEIFNGYNPTDAHIATLYSGRSRGYGFVQFEDQEHQLAALAAINGKEIQGAEAMVKLTVEIAMADRHTPTSEVLDNTVTDNDVPDSPLPSDFQQADEASVEPQVDQ